MTTISELKLEAELNERELDAPRIQPADLDNLIKKETYHTFPDTLHTICVLTLKNGFTVSGENACVSRKNWRPDLAAKLSYENARVKLWELLGFSLKQKLYEESLATPSVNESPTDDACPLLTKHADVLTDIMAREELVEKIAILCHEANRAYCAALGDHSQKAWDEAPEWQRQSARMGVAFHLDNPDSKPSDSHTEWLKVKEADGWTYGPVKNEELKQHPCFVPYEQLPATQQAKDYIFTAIVKNYVSP